MTSDSAVAIHKKVSRLIDNANLHEAFSILKERLNALSFPELSDRLKNMEETYKYMIHYLVEGYADSGRDSMLADIVAQLRFINDSVMRKSVLTDSPDIYSSTQRFEQIRKSSLHSRLAAYKEAYPRAMLATETGSGHEYIKQADEALSSLFSFIWTMFGSPQSDYESLSNAVINEDLPFQFKSQVISALMLGCLCYFDKNALNALLDIYEADINEKISARALVAIFFVIASNSQRVSSDPKIKSRISLWQDSIVTYRRLREVLMNIIKSQDTQRISSKMQNEVLPELMKLRPDILKKLKNVSEESDIEMLDINPEWEELLNKNGLGDKLKELTEMQMEGGDVMMVAFSNLKTFPFFNTVGNWFLPFSSNHSEVVESAGSHFASFSQILDMEGVMCDSDKYSFALSIGKMPDAQRNMIAERMDSQMSQLKEAIGDRNLKSSVPEFDGEVTRYVRDIYRFFKLFRKKGEFNDPFASPIDFRSLPHISDILSDNEIINLVGEFYFKRNYFREALPLLEILDRENPNDPLLWEKIGYCHNALNNIEESILWYKKAELLNPDSKWLIKKLAVCNRMLGRYAEAAEYYAKALATDPENYNILMNSGHCLLESGSTQDALSNYYHANYIRPDRISTLRAIAWAEFMNENKKKSLTYYTKILESNESGPTDYLNAGHLYYLNGNLKKAVECYKTAAGSKDWGIEKLVSALKEDMPTIEKGGGKKEEINLLLDKIQYDMSAN